ncbi:class I SAM-dependent methyltransferase [Photobacterium chitinilyticum]|uniref:Class I SAM-dependent methyltransferase n=1 Tax=Photobacterium chitinilyticum TaxID=2485123 RepID=A0A444JVS0_9GAMM|nr:class I SAM-dependent methyltransferase [Photobacterium chitinilyticum]RWX57184.1 class I SAM-dependent methyltransferase [Photobacterium chitinilyticum]
MQDEYLEYYANYDEEQRLTSQNITRIEFDTTIDQLAEFTQQAKTLTELGAATGRYSLYYANQGLDVTAVELVPELVEQLRANAKQQATNLSIHEANATAVSFIPDQSQDIVLVLGPLYHLQQQCDREAVLREANRILKPNGILAIAYVSRFFVAGLLAKMSPVLVTPDVLATLNETGLITAPEVDTFFRTGYFSTPAEIERLTQSCGFAMKKHIATDGFGRYIGKELNALTETQYQSWLSYHLSVCHEPSLLGSSNHGLVIATKCAS